MYNFTKFSKNYSKTSGSLCNNYRDEPNNTITDSELFKFKTRITGKTPNNNATKDVETAAPLKPQQQI